MNTEQERAAFETFMGKRYPDVSLKRFATGCYLVSMVRHYWEGWKNRAALQSHDQKDAERYRWLRAGGNDDIGVVRGFDGIDYGSTSVACTYEEGLDGDQLDEAIDHARRVEGEGE